jgi:hypothetical protein
MVVHTCHPSYGKKPKIGGQQSSLSWAKSETFFSKIIKKGWRRGSTGKEPP